MMSLNPAVDESRSGVPRPPFHRVLVLTTDHLSLLRSPAETDPAGVFRQLDLRATYFEQHYLQDARNAFALSPGDATELKQFQTDVADAGMTIGILRWTPMCGWTRPEHLIELAKPPAAAKQSPDSGSDGSLGSTLSPADLDFLSRCDFAWIHVASRPTPTSIGTPLGASHETNVPPFEQLLAQILCSQKSLENPHSGIPIQIVTALGSAPQTIPPPFRSQLNETQIRVPLWIDIGEGHACRVNIITGSHDLLPTIRDALFAEPKLAEQLPTQTDRAIHEAFDGTASMRMSMDSCSLLTLCRAPGTLIHRALAIVTDDGAALRTDRFLYVRHDQTPTRSSADSSSQTTTTVPAAREALYAKPEDIWNIMDQASVFEDVVTELAAMLTSSRKSD